MGTEDSTQTPPQVIENVTNAGDNETTTQSVLNCTHCSDRTEVILCVTSAPSTGVKFAGMALLGDYPRKTIRLRARS